MMVVNCVLPFLAIHFRTHMIIWNKLRSVSLASQVKLTVNFHAVKVKFDNLMSNDDDDDS